MRLGKKKEQRAAAAAYKMDDGWYAGSWLARSHIHKLPYKFSTDIPFFLTFLLFHDLLVEKGEKRRRKYN